MRYNKSEIMKMAWTLKKGMEDLTFSEALKKAWEVAKRTAGKAKTIVKKHIQITSIEKWVLRKMDSNSFLAIKSGIEAADDIILERETEKAIEISTEWNGYRKNIWLPKSACEYRFA